MTLEQRNGFHRSEGFSTHLRERRTQLRKQYPRLEAAPWTGPDGVQSYVAEATGPNWSSLQKYEPIMREWFEVRKQIIATDSKEKRWKLTDEFYKKHNKLKTPEGEEVMVVISGPFSIITNLVSNW